MRSSTAWSHGQLVEHRSSMCLLLCPRGDNLDRLLLAIRDEDKARVRHILQLPDLKLSDQRRFFVDHLGDSFVGNALHCAAVFNRGSSICQWLIGLGLHVDEKAAWSGRTALHFAVLNPKPRRVLNVLLKHGADLQARDVLNRIPLHWSCLSSPSPEAATRLLEEASSSPSSTWQQLHSTDLAGRTPLHLAALHGRSCRGFPAAGAVIVRALIGADSRWGWSCGRRDLRGQTPIQIAKFHEHGNRQLVAVFEDSIIKRKRQADLLTIM